MIFALVGNQNCGKTTLFNALTGANQHVGNFPGITVEHKIGMIKATHNCSIADLPGLYSLHPYSQEEIVTYNFLLNKNPSGIINIIDATNIERNLYLTLQLLELNIPTIIVLNMMDELHNNDGAIDIQTLSKELGVPVIPISAKKNKGICHVIDSIINISNQERTTQKINSQSSTPVHKCIQNISHIIAPHASTQNMSSIFCATQIIEGNISLEKKLKLNTKEIRLINHTILEMEHESGLDKNLAIADMRYNIIENLSKKTVIKPKESKEHKRSIKIDKILTNKYLSLPIFFIIMFIIFWLTFNVIGDFLSTQLSSQIEYITNIIDCLLATYNVNPAIHSLIINGILSGIGSVLSFLPIIITLFFFLSILEDTGYMARITFIMDKLLGKIGLSGKSLVPMLIGFGCSVPAIMATRTLPSRHDKRTTIFLIPYMSCSAKIPIYAIFCEAFFEKHSALVMIALYITGILIGIIIAYLLKNSILKPNSIPFIIELPNYRFPSAKNTFLLIRDKSKDFIEKAFTIIFISTIIIWFLQTFDLNLNIVQDNKNSILALISQSVTPIFTPLGFGDWRIITALISGVSAKEAVISTLSILLNAKNSELKYILPSLFTPPTVISFLVFTLLYTPCIASIATIKKELKSSLQTILLVLFQCIISWLISFTFFQICSLIL